MIEKINASVNLLAFMLVVVAAGFVALHQPEIAKDIVIGAIGLLGGSKLASAKKEGE
jgi:hypothetical protein